jgi:trehalose 6-phosphate synthase
MRFLVRLLAGIWLATLIVSAGFAYLEVREERARLVEDLKRRAALVGYTVGQAAEGPVARGGNNKAALERILTRFSRADRPIAVYDAFGSVLAATSEVRPFLGPISPLITEAIEKNEQVAKFQPVAGRLTWVHVLPLLQDERPIGAAAVLLDAQYLDAADWNLWRRTAVRLGVLMLLVTGITWAAVRWSVTRPMARIAEWTKQLKAGQPVAPPPEADASLFGPLATEVTSLARTLARVR